MLTEAQLREIEAAEQAARTGPWTWGVRYIGRPMEVLPGSWYEKIAQLPEGQPVEKGSPWERDAIFIAGARVWVPQLLAMVRELQGENAELKEFVLDLEHQLDKADPNRWESRNG